MMYKYQTVKSPAVHEICGYDVKLQLCFADGAEQKGK